MSPMEKRLEALVAEIELVDEEAATTARARHEKLIKPAGSLGRLEELGAQLAAIAAAPQPPALERPAVVVAAGDNGVLAQGVSIWPAEVTAVMVGQFCAERAAVNALAGVVGAEVRVLDVGVASELTPHPLLRAAKVRPGTADLSLQAAMERKQAAQAILAGAELARELISAGVDLFVTGDMGIANTTPAACLIAAFTGCGGTEVVGPGAGGDGAAVAHKVEVVERALALHRPRPSDPLGAMAALGGLEHAALAGLILAAAAARLPVILDGVSCVAAALTARALCPAAAGYMIAGHRSTEPGASIALEALGLDPLIDLRMRLGEGTGGLLAVPLVRAAAAALAQMATLEEIGIAP